MDWATDWGLRVRMGASLLGMLVLYAAFGAVLLSMFLTGSGYIWLLIGVFGLFTFVQYRFGSTVTLKTIGAKPIEEIAPDGEGVVESARALERRIERLSHQADLPVPDLALAEYDAPNAFAIGRNRTNATVCVTTGLLDALDDEELDAVVAHELAHIKNRDVMLLTLISFLSTLTFVIVRHAWFFDGGGSSGGGGGDSSVPWLLVFFVVTFIVWVGSYLLTRAISRYREFAADRGAIAITGEPANLASALTTISHSMDDPEVDLREKAGLNAFFIIPADPESRILSLMKTHPSTERRLDKLKTLERSRQ